MKKILIALLSSLLFSLPWLGFPAYTLFVAFIPLLCLQEAVAGEKNEKGKPKRFFFYPFIALFAWSVITVWWIWYAVEWVVLVPFIGNTYVGLVSWLVYDYVRKRAPKMLAYCVLVAGWIGYEYIYLNGELIFPWLILGNGFANTVEIVQWFEFTGTLGGSLWVWIVNITLYEAWKKYREEKSWRRWITPAVWLVVPIGFSLVRYATYRETENPVKVTVLQPNIDPYTEKFGTMSQDRQTEILLRLARQAPEDVDFIVGPETSLDDRLWEHDIRRNGTISLIGEFMRRFYPDAAFITGATTRREYRGGEVVPHTARTYDTIDFWYDTFNSAVLIDSSGYLDVYHKSKLVPGAEMIPYTRWFPRFKDMVIDLGGGMGQFGTDPVRKVFSTDTQPPVGVSICYESIFGEYCGEYVRNGAEALFIITNDGWWKDTPGYRQHFSFARLLALETRRSVARSANTGISAFIDQRGNVVSRTGWDERVALTGEINLNDKITFYARYGDMLGRISIYTFILCMLYYVAYRRKRKDHLLK